MRLSSQRRRAKVELAVYDAVAFPNPLVVCRHEIVLCPHQNALQVMESILIDNPSQSCYVGAGGDGSARDVATGDSGRLCKGHVRQ